METAARRQWLTLVLLTTAFALNYMDRQVINILAQPIKAELHISDTALSFLAGTAFTLVYAFAAIPIARVADRFDRVTVLTTAIAFWSVMTGLCGFALGYLPLLLFRIGVGFGEAGGIPASHSLIADHFDRKRRAFAMGVYAFGLPAGTLLGLMMGGIVNDLVGWRWTFVIAAAPGVLLALVVRGLLHELPRGHSEPGSAASENVSLKETMAILSRNLPYWVITLGCGAALLSVYVANAWFPPMLIRLHHMPVHQVGIALGLFAGIGGGASTLASGRIAQVLTGRVRNPEILVAVAGLILSFPLYLVAVTSHSTPIALAAMAGEFTVMYAWIGPSYAVTQRVVPVHMRALASSIQIAAGSVIAQIFGPQLVGILSDTFGRTHGVEGLRNALLCVSVVSLVGAGLFFASGLMLTKAKADEAALAGALKPTAAG
ncbi:MAG TPA: MFS transporter [Caulobacteraceae bacterium]|jgi:MFS family permease|nr:MFS transporter [Caulobacteraceae bacterium]